MRLWPVAAAIRHFREFEYHVRFQKNKKRTILLLNLSKKIKAFSF
jgi:hypothetical protein